MLIDTIVPNATVARFLIAFASSFDVDNYTIPTVGQDKGCIRFDQDVFRLPEGQFAAKLNFC